MKAAIARAFLRIAYWVDPEYVGPIWRPTKPQ
jgi:hypothetical protein